MLIVNKYAHVTGGADRHCLDLARAIRDCDHEVAFLSTASSDNEECAGWFVMPTVTSESRDALPARRRIAVARRALWNPEAAKAMEAAIQTFRPEVVHTHKLYPQLSVAPVVVATRRGIPVVQTIHDHEFVSANPFDGSGSAIDRLEERAEYRLLNTAMFTIRRHVHVPRISAWIAVSKYIARACGTRSMKPVVLPTFVSTKYKLLPGYAKRQGAVFAGRLHSSKGAFDVVELARRLPSLSVTMLGWGPLHQEIRAAERKLGNLTFGGYVDAAELTHRLASARVAVIPSRNREAGPLIAIEAMSVGTPIVAYESGGLAEYVRNAAAGKVVPWDVDALARAVREINETPRLWDTYSENGRRAVREQHSLETYVPRLEAVYERVAGHR